MQVPESQQFVMPLRDPPQVLIVVLPLPALLLGLGWGWRQWMEMWTDSYAIVAGAQVGLLPLLFPWALSPLRSELIDMHPGALEQQQLILA